MPTFAGIDGNDVVSLCYAPARINAEKAWTMKGVERIAELPDREGGWTFSAARAHLFPAECAHPFTVAWEDGTHEVCCACASVLPVDATIPRFL